GGFGGGVNCGFSVSGTGVDFSMLGRLFGEYATRVLKSSKQNIRKMPRNRNPAMPIMAFTGLSLARCMKNRATSVAFTVAMLRAMVTLAELDGNFTYEAPTVIAVRISSAV